MPTGRVKWYDAAKGFGFVTSDEGGDVFLPKGALPDGVADLRAGQRPQTLACGAPDGERGEALPGVTAMLLEMQGNHRLDGRALVGVEVATIDEVVGQGPGLGRDADAGALGGREAHHGAALLDGGALRRQVRGLRRPGAGLEGLDMRAQLAQEAGARGRDGKAAEAGHQHAGQEEGSPRHRMSRPPLVRGRVAAVFRPA